MHYVNIPISMNKIIFYFLQSHDKTRGGVHVHETRNLLPSMLSPIPFLLVIFCIYGCKAFVYNCTYSCGDVSCPPVTTTGQRKCKNMYLDHCGCCAYCAKSEGDKCGGKMNLWGSCEPGFECTYRSGSVYNEERFGFCEHGELHINCPPTS